MKWFQHDTTALEDFKMRKLKLRFGLAGIGLYWVLVEMTAKTMPERDAVLECDLEVLADLFKENAGDLEAMLDYIIDLDLFQREKDGMIHCRSLRTRTDETTKKLLRKQSGKIRKGSGKIPATLQDTTEQDTTEQDNTKKEYDPKFEIWYESYPRKIGKKQAAKAWNARVREGVDPDDLIAARNGYVAKCTREHTEEKFMMHPATFLGPNERWKDFLGFPGLEVMQRKFVQYERCPHCGADALLQGACIRCGHMEDEA